MGLFRRKRRYRKKHGKRRRKCGRTLADMPVGCRVFVRGFADTLPLERRASLQAYGLAPGYSVRIMQHSPVTVIQVDNLELALEGNLAEQVQVEDI